MEAAGRIQAAEESSLLFVKGKTKFRAQNVGLETSKKKALREILVLVPRLINETLPPKS